MRRRLWHFFPTYYAGFVLGFAAISAMTSVVLEREYRAAKTRELEATSRLLHDQISPLLQAGDTDALQPKCEQFAAHTGHRAVVISRSGRLLADSRQRPAGEQLAIDSPEIQAVLTGSKISDNATGLPERRSSTLALPITQEGTNIAVLRTLQSPTVIESGIWQIRLQILASGSAVALLALGLVLGISRRVRLPLATMRQGAERFGRGELSYKLELPASDEMSRLAGALNAMARQLEQRIGAMTRQGSEQAAVLASMVEGVLAVDTRQHVISINAAAARLMGISAGRAKGRSLPEVIRNADLLRFVTRTLECNEPVEDDVVLRGDSERVLQTRGTSLRNSQGTPIGAVVVLHDVTRIRKLESLRRDFVANVSHELKTPITSIKGFVETLLDGALAEPADAERFLRIVARQADRLNAIIEDLLSLAKIEQSVEAANVELHNTPVVEVLGSAIHECASKAEQRQIRMRLECAADLRADINPPLLEQAIINLLDNAIKYSEPGSEILIGATSSIEAVSVHVQDRGCGIEAEHLDRLFERFYRVDRARSRKFGGTGLGLAIVKHIVHAHGGRVAVSSTPGQGSTFSIHLPLPAAAARAAAGALVGG